MLKRFAYLSKPGTVSVASEYPDLESISKVFVVHNSVKRDYEVYESAEKFLQHLETLPLPQRTYQEVSFNTIQKLKFDIDAPRDIVGDDTDWFLIKTNILNTLTDVFYTTYFIDLQPEDVVVCESYVKNSTNLAKFSMHIILNYSVVDSANALMFADRVIAQLMKDSARFIDRSVYKTVQNFRMVGCHKSDFRVKTIIQHCDVAHSPIDTIISRPGKMTLPDLVKKDGSSNINNITTATICSETEIARAFGFLSADEKTSHIIRSTTDNMIICDRLRASFCDLCKREHTTDNTLMLQILPDGGVLKRCRRVADTAVIGQLRCPVPIAVNDSNCWVDTQIASFIKSTTKSSTTLFDSLPESSKHIYDATHMKPFETADTLVVHAGMKLGKTKSLRDHLNTHYMDTGLRKNVIYFVSFRQTFSGNIKEKFGEFALYSDIKGELSQNRLIVQVESLWRCVLSSEPPDLLILDECESIFEQFDSGLLKNFQQCFAVFQYLLKYSKRVILMDANISDRSFRILEKMRNVGIDNNQSVENNAIIYHHNTNKNAVHDNYYLTGDKAKWLSLLIDRAKNHKIAIPVSSLSDGKTIYELLKTKYADKNIKIYSSETSFSEKRDHFAKVDEYWVEYDILIYTPTITAGVSFEMKHFDYVMGYFIDQSCQVESCIQMIGRIRDVKSHCIIVYISAQMANLPTSVNIIKDQIFRQRQTMSKQYDNMGLTPIIDESGALTYHTSDYFHIWLENQRMRNLSKNNFPKRFMRVVSQPGPTLHLLNDAAYNLLTQSEYSELQAIELITEYKGQKKEINLQQAERIATSRDLTEAEIEHVINNQLKQLDTAPDLLYGYEKHKLKKFYNLDNLDAAATNSIINSKFVLKYKNRAIKAIYRNRMQIAGDVHSQIAKLQETEFNAHKYIMSLDVDEQYRDLTYKYQFNKHRIANAFVQIMGFKDVFDITYKAKLIVHGGIMNHYDQIKTLLIDADCFEFKKPKRDCGQIIEYTNKILMQMYGCCIVTMKDDPNIYFIKQPKLFDW
jgi:hypothetical protein